MAIKRWWKKHPNYHQKHNPEAAKNRSLKRAYGITLEQYEKNVSRAKRTLRYLSAYRDDQEQGWNGQYFAKP